MVSCFLRLAVLLSSALQARINVARVHRYDNPRSRFKLKRAPLTDAVKLTLN